MDISVVIPIYNEEGNIPLMYERMTKVLADISSHYEIIFVNDYSISVIVDAEQLGEAEIAQIQNIVVRELNAKIEDIHVSKIEE